MGNFNILHNNLNGLENKFDVLHYFLGGVSSKFDIMAITETSQKITDEDFNTNINIDDYLPFLLQPTLTKVEQLFMLKMHLMLLRGQTSMPVMTIMKLFG